MWRRLPWRSEVSQLQRLIGRSCLCETFFFCCCSCFFLLLHFAPSAHPTRRRSPGESPPAARHRCWRRPQRKTEEDHARPRQTTSDQVRPCQTTSDQVRPGRTPSDHIRPGQTRSDPVRPGQTPPDPSQRTQEEGASRHGRRSTPLVASCGPDPPPPSSSPSNRLCSSSAVESNMAVSWLLLVAAGAVFVSMVVLVVGCLHCRNKGPLASIRQSHAEDEASRFRIIHPCPSDPSPAHPAANQSPYSPSVKPGGGRASCTPSQESIASYVNPPEGNRNADSDAEDPGYIEVLPEPSRASSRSSDGPAYENVDPRNHGAQTQGTSSPQQSKSEDESESEDGSNASYVNDTEGDYLNVKPSDSSSESERHVCQLSGAFSPETPESSDSEDSQNYVNVGNESPWSRTDCELFSGHPF